MAGFPQYTFSLASQCPYATNW